jgi:hypothetical protein
LTCSHFEAEPLPFRTRPFSPSNRQPTRAPAPRSYKNQLVRIARLGLDSRSITGLRFENCEIVGPAIISDLVDVRLTSCTLEDSCAVQDVEGPIVGTVTLRGCEFVHCSFADIGFALSPDGARWVRASVARRSDH